MAEINKPSLGVAWAESGSRVEPTDAKKNTGWVVEKPPYEVWNFIEHRQDKMLQHINQHGIVVWDSSTEYIADKSFVQGADGVLYRCKVTNTNQNPILDTSFSYWERLLGRYVSGVNGFSINANGTVEQWGRGSYSGNSDGTVDVSFNIPFPNGCFNVVVSSGAFIGDSTFGADTIDNTKFKLGYHRASGSPVVNVGYYWRAIGH